MPLHMSVNRVQPFPSWMKQAFEHRLGEKISDEKLRGYGISLLGVLLVVSLTATLAATACLVLLAPEGWPSALLAIAASAALLSGFVIHTGRVRTATAISALLIVIFSSLPGLNAFLSGEPIGPWHLGFPLAAATVAALLILLPTPVKGRKPEPDGKTTDLSSFTGLPGIVTRHDIDNTVLAVEHDGDHALGPVLSQCRGRKATECLFITDRLPFLEAMDRLRTGEDHCSVPVRLRPTVPQADGQDLIPVSAHLLARRNAEGILEGIACWWLPALQHDTCAAALDGDREIHSEGPMAGVDFLRVLGHELRTPLTTVIGNAELLLRSGGLTDEKDAQRQRLDAIRMAGLHLMEVAEFTA